MAEYRELPRIFTVVRKHIEAGKTIKDFDIPEQYVLGKGHVTFFYDKLSYLHDRYTSLTTELRSREFSINELLNRDIHISMVDLIDEILLDYYTVWDNRSYWPTPEEIYLNMARLCTRSKIESVLNELKSED